MTDLVKYLERYHDKVVTTRDTLTSAKVEINRLASKLNGVGEQFEGTETDWRTSASMAKAAAEMERSKAKRLHNSMKEAQGQRYGHIGNLKYLRGELESLKGKSRSPDQLWKIR